MVFDKTSFEKHQKLILWFANTWVGRRVLYIQGGRSDVGKNRITRILPNAIFWREGKKYKAEFRTHDKFAKRLFYTFKPVWFLFHIWDTLLANNFQPNWNFGFDVYPDVFSNTGGDGSIPLTNNTWATVHDAVDGASCNNAATSDKMFQCAFITPTYYFYRGFFPFDTSGLNDIASISATVFSVVNNDRHNTSETVDVVQSTQGSNTNLVLGDFDQLGTTVGGNKVLSTFSNDDTTYDGITLNATGISWVSKTGFTKLAVRAHNDTINNPATTWEDLACYFADQAGTTKDPKLVVTYTVPAVGSMLVMFK